MDPVVYPIDKIKNKLKPVFDGQPVYKAVLFGSYATGQATGNSDVDIVIDSRGELLNINFYGLLDEITQVLAKKIDLFEMSEIKRPSTIYEEISSKGVVLYDR